MLMEYGARVRVSGAIITATSIRNMGAVKVMLDNRADIEERE